MSANTSIPAGPFPPRDLSKPVEQQGIFQKFEVSRKDGSSEPGGKHEDCRYFVLDLNHDQHAPAAMRVYAASCAETHPELAAEIIQEYGPNADCSGDPTCCPDNEGYGCACDPLNTAASQCDVCAGTETAFGKRCECAEGVANG